MSTDIYAKILEEPIDLATCIHCIDNKSTLCNINVVKSVVMRLMSEYCDSNLSIELSNYFKQEYSPLCNLIYLRFSELYNPDGCRKIMIVAKQNGGVIIDVGVETSFTAFHGIKFSGNPNPDYVYVSSIIRV